MGTDADPSLPRAIAGARKAYPKLAFKAGHLLNADFGGAGSDPANLTILTAAGNSAHRGFDNPVKAALAALGNAYRAMWNDGIKIEDEQTGIAVRVAVTGNAWGPSGIDRYIFDELTCTASPTGGETGEAFRDPYEESQYKKAMALAQSELSRARTTIPNPKPPMSD